MSMTIKNEGDSLQNTITLHIANIYTIEYTIYIEWMNENPMNESTN